jgi:branched-chain amino acid transport system permease protein
VVCVLGGLGSVQGALIGGLTYGIVEAFATQIDVTIGTQHISGSGLQDAIALVVLLIVLIVRPRGIMGRAVA